MHCARGSTVVCRVMQQHLLPYQPTRYSSDCQYCSLVGLSNLRYIKDLQAHCYTVAHNSDVKVTACTRYPHSNSSVLGAQYCMSRLDAHAEDGSTRAPNKNQLGVSTLSLGS